MILVETKVDETFIKLMNEYRTPPVNKGLLEACSNNVILFSERMLGFKLYSWQVKFLWKLQNANDNEREFLVLTSRQIGKSTAIAVFALWACIFNKNPGTIHNNTVVGIVSASDTQSKKLLYEIKKFIKTGDRFVRDTYQKDGTPLFGKKFFTNLLDEKEPNNTTTITFKSYSSNHGEFVLKDSKSGSLIKSYPPTAVVLGECEVAGAQILMLDGSHKNIEDIKPGDYVITSNHFENSFNKVIAVKNNGIKEVINFVTSHGREITVTHNHPLMTKRGWRQAKDITKKDFIATLKKLPFAREEECPGDDEAKFLGYMMGDGTCTKRTTLSFSQQEGKQKDEFTKICENLGFSCSWQKDKRHNVFNAHISVNAWGLLEKYGLAGKYSENKVLPTGFYSWLLEYRVFFLSRYFSCDGWIMNNTKRPEIGLYSKSKKLIQQVQHELLNFGVQSSIRIRTKGEFVGYELGIRSKLNISNFVNNIGIFGKTEDIKIKVSVDQSKTNDFMDFEFERIRSIEKLPSQLTYGITVEDSHCYISNGVLSHNTFTVVIEDEAGKSEKITDQFHYDYVYPTGNSTNALRVYLSTPWVTSGFFYRLADPMSEFSDHAIDRMLFTIDAIKLENPKYYSVVKRTIDQMNKDGKTDEVQRAYYCRFVKGESSYFNPKMVYEIFDGGTDFVYEFSGQCDMGVDFGGQVKSKTVITISRFTDEGVIERLYHKVYEVGKDLDLLSDIEYLLKVFGIQRIIPDDCPSGDYLIRQMIEKGWNVQPMNFRKDKVKKYGALRAMINKGKVKSYLDDDLKTEMLALEFSNSSKQSLIQHAPGYSDDLIDSFLMSCYFFLQEEGVFKYYDLDDVDDSVEVSSRWWRNRL